MDKKVTNSLNVEVPKGFVDEGDGVVSFPNGLTITDGTIQRNGTVYDIDTLDISRYGNQLTGDHEDKLSSLIGEVIGVVKRDGKVVVNKIRYAVKENPYARLAYDLLVGGFSKNFSTETLGMLGADNVWRNTELVGLSQVVTQNNYNAHINKVVHNSLEQAKHDGLDVTGIEEKILSKNHVEEEHKMEENKDKKVEETEKVVETQPQEETKTAPKVEEVKVEETKTETTEEKPKAPATEETQKEAEKVVETQAPASDESEKATNDAEETNKKVEETKVEEKTEEVKVEKPATEETKTEESETKTETKDEKMEEKTSNGLTAEQTAQLAEVMKNALAPITSRLATIEEKQNNAFDASAKEPEFKKEGTEVAKNSLADMAFEDRYQKHIDAAWNAIVKKDPVAWKTLNELNQYNLDALKGAGYAANSITLDDLGNFVIPEEMYREIQGKRTNYSAIINATEWRETSSLEFVWQERDGDIDMQPVAIGSSLVDANGPVSDNARLKPISEYGNKIHRSQLEELAAVTVVATSTTRFFAADLLSDAAAGYRNDYDRKRAQLVIARLEGAIDETGFSVPYNPSNDVDALTAWLEAVTEISDTTLNGVLIFNARTFAEVKSRALKAGVSGPLSEIFRDGELPTIFGYQFIVVPNDLMPSLGGNETVRHLVDGEWKTINHAVFFAELSTFTGRTAGGLQYDISNDAAYEVNGAARSAFQRNELVLRGSFYRGGAVLDKKVVAGIRQGNAANVS